MWTYFTQKENEINKHGRNDISWYSINKIIPKRPHKIMARILMQWPINTTSFVLRSILKNKIWGVCITNKRRYEGRNRMKNPFLRWWIEKVAKAFNVTKLYWWCTPPPRPRPRWPAAAVRQMGSVYAHAGLGYGGFSAHAHPAHPPRAPFASPPHPHYLANSQVSVRLL